MILQAASEFGLSITPVIAGLGIGGLAVALAIRPTLENIIGGFVLFADKPVKGSGSSAALATRWAPWKRSACARPGSAGSDRTVITVPNADFAQLQIVNYTRRDMNLFQSSIGLRYETTPDQLRYVAARIRKLLIQHNKVLPDPVRWRLSAFGDSASLEVFAFVRSADWDEFLAVKEDLNLRIAEIVRKFGTGFAFPSQTVYFSRDAGVDGARAEEAEAEVRRWREEKRLPFPEFDFAERAEMADTLPFPPEGSPDFRPNPQQTPQPSDSGDPLKRHSGWLKLLRRRKEPAAAQD